MTDKKYLVLVPYCVRNIHCKADVRDGELICSHDECRYFNNGDCAMRPLLEEAKARKLTVRVLMRDEFVQRIIAEENPEVILGMSCGQKINKITDALVGQGIDCFSAELDDIETCFKHTGKPSTYNFDAYKALLDNAKAGGEEK